MAGEKGHLTLLHLEVHVQQGIMADDIVAGIYAAALSLGVASWLGQESYFPWTY